MIKITAQPVAEPVSVDFVKDYLHWLDTDAGTENIISYYITAAREEIEKHTNLSLVEKTYSQWVKESNMMDLKIDLFYPPHYEIVKVVKISDSGEETTKTRGSGYTLYEGKRYTIKFDDSGFYRVDFKSGYGDEYGQALPALLKMAIAEQVGNWYEGHTEVGELSKSVIAKVGKYSMNLL
ncbi:MAG: hypothetical protein R6U65_00985 [Perlabentimonas sp.]